MSPSRRIGVVVNPTKFDDLDIGLPIQKLRQALSTVQLGREEYIDKTLEGVDRRGRRILCRIRVSPMTDDEGGGHGLVILFHDITADRAKEDHGRYLGRIMGRALNEVYFLDPQSLRFTLTNEGAQRKLGYSATQLAQMTLLDVAPLISAEAAEALVTPLLSGAEKEVVFETTIQGHEREYPAELCLQYFGDEEPQILVAVVHDITERRQLGEPAASAG